MLKLSVLLLLVISLYAEGIDDADLEGIYTEALWFVAVIGVMSAVSFVVSRRNAQNYEEELRLKKIAQVDEASEKYEMEKSKVAPSSSEVDRLLELSKMHKEGLLSKEEFMAFKLKLYRNIESIHP